MDLKNECACQRTLEYNITLNNVRIISLFRNVLDFFYLDSASPPYSITCKTSHCFKNHLWNRDHVVSLQQYYWLPMSKYLFSMRRSSRHLCNEKVWSKQAYSLTSKQRKWWRNTSKNMVFFRLSEFFFYPLLARLDIGAGVEQPFGCLIVQNRQAV